MRLLELLERLLLLADFAFELGDAAVLQFGCLREVA
jgi:hypothetical protein